MVLSGAIKIAGFVFPSVDYVFACCALYVYHNFQSE